MTIFQLVTLENPIKLTPKGQGTLNYLSEKLDPKNLATLPDKALELAKDSWDGLMIGLSLGEKGDDPYFVDFCERDLP